MITYYCYLQKAEVKSRILTSYILVIWSEIAVSTDWCTLFNNQIVEFGGFKSNIFLYLNRLMSKYCEHFYRAILS